jgi:predicted TIM-barrel fold metal-dependent hydrolase
MLEEYLSDVQTGHKVVASVYVESRSFIKPDGPEALRPIGEVEFANGIGAIGLSGCLGPPRVCAAIVGYADFRLGDALAEFFDSAMQIAPSRFRGVRQVTMEPPTEALYRLFPHPPPRGIMQSNGFDRAFAHLAPRGLSFDAAIFNHQVGDVIALADRFPDTTIILNHMGTVLAMDLSDQERTEVFRQWGASLRELARRDNVFCKIGGLGVPFWDFGFIGRDQPASSVALAEAWKPHVETAIEAFGAHRCMMESNFPPDGESCGYVPLWNAMKRIVNGASSEDKAALFHGTAAKVYRIELT